jgi:two-component system sensor histidine kinase MtrB
VAVFRPIRSYWRRNLQLRLVVIALAISAIVLGLVGALLLNRVTSGLLQAKERASISEATAAQLEVQRLLNASDTGLTLPNATRLVDSAITALAVRSGSPGLFEALLLSDPALVGQPERGTKLVAEMSVPTGLRTQVQKQGRQLWQYSRITYEDGTTRPGIVVGAPIVIPQVGAYELYMLFPLEAEQSTIDLVRRAVFVTGILLMLGIGLLVSFITSRVTAPVREAALIAEDLASGEFDRRMEVRGEDDLARLAGSFNEMAQSLQNQIVNLERLSHVQQRFVSDVSHELRTPLTTVRMASEMIYDQRSNLDPATARSAELLRNQVDRFDVMLSDLLEISRIDAGAAQIETAPLDLHAMTMSVINEYEEIAANHNTELMFNSPDGPVFVEADTRRVSRIVRNLVANAIEHSEGKPIQISVCCNAESASVGVRDYGHGIAPSDYDRVFSRFWRADPSRTRTLGGTGLGLAISADDAALHGGRIDVGGHIGSGAHFVLTLPLVPHGHFETPAIEVSNETF